MPLGYPHLHNREMHKYCNEWEVHTFVSINAVSDNKHRPPPLHSSVQSILFYLPRAFQTFAYTPASRFNPITCRAKRELRGLSSSHTESLPLYSPKHTRLLWSGAYVFATESTVVKIKYKTIHISKRTGCGGR